MLPTDRRTRGALPPIGADPQEIAGPELTVVGSLAVPSEIPFPAAPPAMHSVADQAPGEQEGGPTAHGFDGNPATMPIKNLAPSSDAHDLSGALGATDGPNVISISVAQNSSGPRSPAITQREGAGSHDGHDHQDEPSGDDAGGGVSLGPNDSELDEIDDPPTGVGAGSNDLGPAGTDDVHSINVMQTVLVDQDASFAVSGYVGEVAARLHIFQDLVMDQDVDISLTVDGEGNFAVLLDQEMRIDQEIDLDLEIFDVDGVLHLDVFLWDSVEVEQDTTIDLRISDGPPGGTVDVNQDIELDQDVDIDIDIDSELEELYAVRAYVDVLQQANADQYAVVDIEDWNGKIDMDVDATQTAIIEQQTVVQVDFALV
ncbi:hypothetical protein ACFSOZ_15755 [Mesorhizobium newzealandense]|uniref:DUF5801 domain-containing protein n=1 Tax=Mesorhizobium newzealandense TaxID=1300302 RepID=A0ABW4U9U0_9HYPH